MPDNMTRFVVDAADDLGLHDIKIERRTKHMRLTARTSSGASVLVGFSEKHGEWRARKNLLADLRRQARGAARVADNVVSLGASRISQECTDAV